jgi:acetolactate synthase-1/3 small subunit
MRHIISVLLENEPGALSRVVGLFSQRNYNIETLTVAPTEDPTLSRLTLTTVGHDEVIEQITKNLNKLIEVVKLVNLSEGSHIERELMLVKIKATGAQRAEVKRTTDIFRGQIVDVTSSVYTVQPRSSRWCAPAYRALPVAKKCLASNLDSGSARA